MKPLFDNLVYIVAKIENRKRQEVQKYKVYEFIACLEYALKDMANNIGK
jgi:hypothetical protein